MRHRLIRGVPAALLAVVVGSGCAPAAPPDPGTDAGPVAPSPAAPDSGERSPHDIPARFPIVAGWPDDDEAEPGLGLEGVGRDLEPLSWELCGDRVSATGARDRLGAAWNNVEDFRRRELLTFDDADVAVAFTSSWVGSWRECPRDDLGDGHVYVHRVRRTGLGGESWALVRRIEYDGYPAVGLTVVHMIRLGRAVLLDSVSNEGGAGPDPTAEVERQIAEQGEAVAPVVAAMCRFTEARRSSRPAAAPPWWHGSAG